jgi:hypothetical protein
MERNFGLVRNIRTEWLERDFGMVWRIWLQRMVWTLRSERLERGVLVVRPVRVQRME